LERDPFILRRLLHAPAAVATYILLAVLTIPCLALHICGVDVHRAEASRAARRRPQIEAAMGLIGADAVDPPLSVRSIAAARDSCRIAIQGYRSARARFERGANGMNDLMSMNAS
jgi:hypothetical protein